MNDISQTLMTMVSLYGLKVVGAVLILILGRIVAGVGRSVVKGLMTKTRTDPAVTSFVSSLTFFLLLTFAVLAALAKFGVETTSFVAVIGAGGFAVGFALQGSLANFAAGVLILVLRPFRVGDYIEAAGIAGAVQEIQLFTTILSTPDNIRILVPNGKIYGDIIKNVTANDTRRVDLEVGISYSAPIGRAMDIIKGLLDSDERVLKEPEPQIAVAQLADSSVNLVVRPWAKKEDYWALKFDLNLRIKESFDAQGIEIPFPQRVVHIVNPGQN